jgi:xylose dehydrogenase (NAD/NADP)
MWPIGLDKAGGAVTVGWGVLGSGQMARHLSWVIETVPGNRLIEEGYETLLASPQVDVVYVALPGHLHERWSTAALAAGKHVLCEKPLGLSAAEIDRMVAARGDRLLLEAAFWRWQPRIRLATSLIDRIGPVEHVEAGFTFSGATGWRLDPACGGGAGYDLGCYPVGAALLFAGPMEVVSARSRMAAVDLETSYLGEHHSGATSVLRAAIDAPRRQWLIVTGAHGEIELPGDAFTGPGELLLSDGSGTERISVAGEPGRSGYAEMVEAVAAAVRGEPCWLPPPQAARAVAGVLEAARGSAAAGGAAAVVS